MKPKLEQRVLVDEITTSHQSQYSEIYPINHSRNTLAQQAQTVGSSQSWLAPTEKKAVASFYSYWCVIMNLFFGLFGLVILLLILPILALLIYIDSSGPIFYRQERLGYKGAIFRMYKFRTMSVEAGRARHLTLTVQHDPRVTRVGSFLRVIHLDELPQVINILRGEMSLVGPRPEIPEFAVRLEKVLSHYPRRLGVKPGLTGLAQIKHHYGDTIQDEKIKLDYDLYYLENQSFRLDMQIILKTGVEVLFGHGR